jgi:hypothetical protein
LHNALSSANYQSGISEATGFRKSLATEVCRGLTADLEEAAYLGTLIASMISPVFNCQSGCS